MIKFSLIVLVLAIALTSDVSAFNITNTNLQVKQSALLGIMELTYAQWEISFDENLYFPRPIPCSAGLCTKEADFALNNDCRTTCQFHLHGSQCGSTDYPSCQNYCQALKSTYCLDDDWTLLQVGVETEILTIDPNEYQYFRFDWHEPCHALRIDIFTISGRIQSWATPDFAQPNLYTSCLETNLPATWGHTCPSKFCYKYGTWFMKTLAYTIGGTYSIKISALPLEAGPRKTIAPIDVSPSICELNYPGFTCLSLGVPLDLHLAIDDYVALYQINIPYCGQIFAYLEIVNSNPIYAETTILGLSTDPYNPVALDFNKDQIFTGSAPLTAHVCPQEGLPVAMIFLTVSRSYGHGLGYTDMILTVDIERTDNVWPRLALGEQNSDLYSKHMQFPSNMVWALGITAGTHKVVCGEEEFRCNTGSYFFGSCSATWSAFPQTQPNALIPLRDSILDSFTTLYDIEYPLTTVSPGKYGLTLLLEVKVSGSTTVQNLPDWRNTLGSCRVISGDLATIGSSKGEWPNWDLIVPVSPAKCDNQDLNSLTEQMQHNIDQFLDSPHLAITNRYVIDSFTFLEPWQGCTATLLDSLLYDVDVEIELQDTKLCFNSSDMEDPCCNTDLSYEQCCAGRDITTMIVEQSPHNVSLLPCGDPECSYDQLTDYSDFLTSYKLGQCDPPYQLDEVLISTSQIYHRCFETNFGQALNGLSCYLDSDCTHDSIHDSSQGNCDVIARRCIFDRPAVELDFFRCLNNSLSSSVKIALVQSLGSSSDFISFLEQNFINNMTCLDKLYGHPVSKYSTHFTIDSPYPNCQPCAQIFATDFSAPTPAWCDYRLYRGGSCSYVWQLTKQAAVCSNPISNFITPPINVVKAICGNEEFSTNCIEVLPTATEACVLANGEIVYLSPQQCLNSYSCTDPRYTTSSSCLNSGHCTDEEDIHVAIGGTTWFAPYLHNYTGYCALPIAPYNSPDCSVLYTGSFPTNAGCIALGRCTSFNIITLDCVIDYNTKSSCQTAGGQWYNNNPTQAECEALVGCEEKASANSVPAMSKSGSALISAKSGPECAKCGGQSRTINKWLNNRWLPGVPKTVKMVQPQLVNSVELAATINFYDLFKSLQSAVKTSTAAQLLNNLQCSYSNQMRLLKIISCDCPADNNSNCFDLSVPNIGAGLVCPDVENFIVASHVYITIPADSVRYLVNECTNLTVYNLLANNYNPPKFVITTAGFVPVVNDYFDYTYLSVVDDKGLAIGQVIGDGAQIVFRNSSVISSLYICLNTKTDRLLVNPDFQYYDLGYQSGSKVKRLEVNVTVINDRICGWVLVNGDLTVLPINYGLIADTMTQSEINTAYVVGSLYSAVCFGLVVKMLMMIFGPDRHDDGDKSLWARWVDKISRQPTLIMWLMFILMTAIRAVNLFLAAEGVLDNPNANEMLTFVLMNLPLVLYTIGSWIVGLAFYFMYRKYHSEYKIRASYFFFLCITIIISMILVFIGFALAFNYLVLTGQENDTICSITIDKSGYAVGIRIFYIVVLSIFAFVVSITDVYFGYKLWHGIREMYGSARVGKIAITSALGIFIDSIAFLIYYAINSPWMYFSIILIFTELCPIILVLYFISYTSKSDSNESDGGGFIKSNSTNESVASVSDRFS